MIDPALLQAATAKLVLESLSTEDRERLLTDALTKVLTPVEQGSWPNKRTTSPLQDAFDEACRRAAARVVEEYFKRPEVVARVEVVITEAAKKAFEKEGGIANELANRMASNLWRRD